MKKQDTIIFRNDIKKSTKERNIYLHSVLELKDITQEIIDFNWKIEKFPAYLHLYFYIKNYGPLILQDDENIIEYGVNSRWIKNQQEIRTYIAQEYNKLLERYRAEDIVGCKLIHYKNKKIKI